MNQRLEKLLTLAFNKGASEGEAEAAFRAARQIVLKTGAYFKEALGSDFADYEEGPAPTFPFGKYKGKSVLEVAKTDMAYLQWFATNVQDKPELVAYIKQVVKRYYQL